MGKPGTTRAAVAVCASLLVLGGCAPAEPQPRPTIGSPSPTPTQTAAADDRARQLAKEWELTGAPLPEDWPDVPLPKGAEVVTAYAIGALPRRTWTATFTTDSGTALDMADPIVAELRAREYVPIAEYVGAAETNTGLYSFAAPSFAVYVVLGEDDGQPNLVVTVRGSTDPLGTADLTGRTPTATGAPPAAQTATAPASAPGTARPSPAKDGASAPSGTSPPTE
jgi:hypothetical protein